MKCPNCGKELIDEVSFCPFCGTRVSTKPVENDVPLYQSEVKGFLKSGNLIIYRDRAEFVMSRVQKMVFPYASIVSMKKGLDRINFVMEDGRTESCLVNPKNVSEAFYIIEQTSKPYIAERKQKQQSGNRTDQRNLQNFCHRQGRPGRSAGFPE